MAKKKTKLPGEEVLKNPKWELFCWLYAGYHNRDLFGNGTRCYMQAYGYNAKIIEIRKQIDKLLNGSGKDSVTGRVVRAEGYSVEVDKLEREIKGMENSARALAAELLAKVSIRQRADYLVDTYITDEHSDRELQYVILQRFDLNSKVQAIKERNRLKDRGSKGNLEGSFVFSWEDGAPVKKGQPAKKRPVLKKVEVKTPTVTEWEE